MNGGRRYPRYTRTSTSPSCNWWVRWECWALISAAVPAKDRRTISSPCPDRHPNIWTRWVSEWHLEWCHHYLYLIPRCTSKSVVVVSQFEIHARCGCRKSEQTTLKSIAGLASNLQRLSIEFVLSVAAIWLIACPLGGVECLKTFQNKCFVNRTSWPGPYCIILLFPFFYFKFAAPATLPLNVIHVAQSALSFRNLSMYL